MASFTSYICVRCLRSQNLSKVSPSASAHLRATSKRTFASARPVPTPLIASRKGRDTAQTSLSPTKRRPQTTSSTITRAKPAAPHPPAPKSAQQLTTTAILNPRRDPDSPTGAEMHIAISPRAAARLTHLMATERNPALCLRISVESGGCHGFQYLMALTDTGGVDEGEDTVFIAAAEVGESGKADWKEAARGRPKVVLDEPSLELLKGSKVDYTMELVGSRFVIADNPRATSSCGCGTSFDVKDFA